MVGIPLTTDHLKGGRFFKLLTRKKKKKDDSPWEMESSLPPQTPPKDCENVTIHPMLVTRSDMRPPSAEKILQRQRSRSMSDLPSVIFHAPDSQAIIVAPENHHSHHLQDSVQLPPFPLPDKWARKGVILDPEERARQRRNLQLQKEREDRALVKEEAERQRRMKLEKEMVLQQEEEEEVRRLAEVKQELSRIKLERRRREQLEKEEEERQRRELEERKQCDRKRRMEEHQRAEEWRRQQAQKVEAAAREAAEIQRREEGKRRVKIQLAEAVVKQTKGERDLMGWATIQSRDTALWRRRYFKFVGNTMLLYQSAQVKWWFSLAPWSSY
jgi:MAP7 domain-containing protein 1